MLVEIGGTLIGMIADVGVRDAQSCGAGGGCDCKAGVIVGDTVARDQLLGLSPVTFVLVKYIPGTLFGVRADIGERRSNNRDQAV